MPRLKILKYGHPLLREKAAKLKSLGTREKDLVAAMAETMYAAHGIGLAATQVGVMERLFVVDVDQSREDSDDPPVRKLRVYINPEITWESDEDEPFTEGCLSIPGFDGEIYRPSRLKIVARDENFEMFEEDADQLLARVIQHELDHLNGVLFVDKLPLLKRPLAAGALGKIKKAHTEEMASLGSSFPVEELDAGS